MKTAEEWFKILKYGTLDEFLDSIKQVQSDAFHAGKLAGLRKVDKMTGALEVAIILAGIADDWNLGTDGKVQIGDVWISCSELKEKFQQALTESGSTK